jgi:fructose-bisphosphate aldolase, class I
MNGAELRMRRLFDKDSGRAFVVAIDHGMLFGAQPGSEDAVGAVERSLSTEPDALLISPGLLARSTNLFAYRGAASPIVRLDFLKIADQTKAYGDFHRVLCEPARAAALGADAVIVYFMIGAADGETFADNLTAIAQTVDEAHQLGLPLIAEVVAWGSNAADRQDADVLSFGARVAVEVGADMIKTEYTGDPESMARVVRGCPAPVLVLGGAKAESEDALLASTRDALLAGAAGVIYGRNIWQAEDPVRVGRAVRSLVHEKG